MNLILNRDLIKKGQITKPDNLEEVTARLWRIQNLKIQRNQNKREQESKESAKISTVKKKMIVTH